MTFFNSDVVRAEMAEIQELQEEVYTNVFKFPMMTKEDQRYHIDILERLCEKQKVMYTRLSLSDDPQAKQMKQRRNQNRKQTKAKKEATNEAKKKQKTLNFEL